MINISTCPAYNGVW